MYYKVYPDAWRIAHWKKNGRPSPPPHIVKFRNIKEHYYKFRPAVFIETGTYKGEMIVRVGKLFKSIISIELDKKLFEEAQLKFSENKKIKIVNGDSTTVLPGILESINEDILFWLDGHYSGGITAMGEKVTPIEEELGIISNHMYRRNLKHVIIIDDARLFNGEDGYPTMDKIRLLSESAYVDYSFNIVNDAIILQPKQLL